MAKNIWLIIVIAAFIGLFCFGLRSKIPMSYREIREGYTAYSLIKTGKDTNGTAWPIFFKADNNYLSTLGVYLRVPSIYLFGLNSLGMRIPGIIVGISAIWLFYLIGLKLFEDIIERVVAVVCFTFSPLLLQTSLLNLGNATILVLFLIGIYGVLTGRFRRKILLLGISIFVLASFFCVYKFQPKLFGSIKRESVIQNFLPASYSFEYAKRLSFDQIYESPLIKDGRNYNRVVFNKYFYAINTYLKSLIWPFNFEKIFSPFQSQTILSKENINSRAFPSLYFWELPLIIAGLIIYIKRRNKKLLILWCGLLVLYLFNNDMVFLLPMFCICESVCFNYIYKKIKHGKRWVFVIVCSSLYLINIFIISNLLLGNYRNWLDENSFQQYQIWTKVTDDDLKNNKITVTDRLGEPLFYFLFYKKIDPEYYLSNKVNGPLINNEVQRIDSVGNTYFKSFKYFDEKRGPKELWVGFSGEFMTSNTATVDTNSVPDGLVRDKIKDVTVIDEKIIGNELWFVETTL